MQAQCRETKDLRSRQKRNGQPGDSPGGRGFGCDAKSGVREAETRGRPRLLAREMVIMEADTQPDLVPSTFHVSRKYRDRVPTYIPHPNDIITTQSPKWTLGFPLVLDSLWA